MLQNLYLSRYCQWLGFLTLAISAFTWWLDLSGIVPACIFCRTERTAMGLLGIMMILPHCRYLTVLLTCCFAAIGLHAVSAHLFLQLKQMTFTWLYTGLATSALLIISAQLIVIVERASARLGMLALDR